MRNKKFFVMVFLFFLLLSSINVKPYGGISAIITVDDEGDGDYISIQEAVNHAKNGDIILVYSGEYNEEVIISDKSITIEGIAHELGKGNDTGEPIISSTGKAIEIYSDNCSIENFTIKGEINIFGNYNEILNSEIIDCNLGIYIDHGKGNRLDHNTISKAQYGGIVMHFSPFTTIRHNIIRDSGGGIAVWDYSKKTEIIENNIINCNYGIAIGGAPSICVVVKHNNLINNSRQAYFENAYFCVWYENYWSDWQIPLPKPIVGTIGGVIIWWIFGIVIPWIQFDWHPLMQPYEWWKE